MMKKLLLPAILLGLAAVQAGGQTGVRLASPEALGTSAKVALTKPQATPRAGKAAGLAILQDEGIDMPTNFYPGEAYTVSVTLANNGADFAGNLYLQFMRYDSEADLLTPYHTSEGVAVDITQGKTKQVSFHGRLDAGMEIGQYVICFTADMQNPILTDGGNEGHYAYVMAPLVIQNEGSVLPASIRQDTDGTFTVRLRNVTGTDWTGDIKQFLTRDGSDLAYQSADFRVSVAGNKSTDLTLSYNVDNLAAGSYSMGLGVVGWDRMMWPLDREDGYNSWPVEVVAKEVTTIASGDCLENLTWTLTSDGLLRINGTGRMVTVVDAPWYDYRDDIRTAEIQQGITNIAAGAFENCEYLTHVSIPTSVTDIASNAFDGCASLRSITLPGGMTTIGHSAFAGCTGLYSITIPGSIKSIGELAFAGCTGLDSITLPATVTAIGRGAFENCPALTAVRYGGSVGQWCAVDFDGVSSNPLCNGSALYANGQPVTNVTFAQGSNVANYVLNGCTSLESVTVASGATSIGLAAFDGCTSLKSVGLPASVSSIGSSAFNGCTSLAEISIPANVKTIDDHMFAGCTTLTSVHIPDGVTSIGIYAFARCSALPLIILPGSVASIDDNAFEDCTALLAASLPEGLTSIGYGAFNGCSGLSFIALPSTLTSLENGVFEGCNGIKRMAVCPTTPPAIETGTFGYYQGVDKSVPVYVPGRSYYTYPAAELWDEFTNYHSFVKTGTCGEGLTWVFATDGTLVIDGAGRMDDYASSSAVPWYEHRGAMTSIVLGAGVTGIGTYAFASCTRVQSMTVEAATPPAVGGHAFDGFGTSIPVYVPVTYLPAYRADGYWSQFPNLQRIPANVIASGTCGAQGDNLAWMFTDDGVLTISGAGDMEDFGPYTVPWHDYSKQVQYVDLQEGMTSIGKYAFYSCDNLGEIVIPNSVATIGSSALTCAGLRTLTLGAGVQELPSLSSCHALTDIWVAEGHSTLFSPDGVLYSRDGASIGLYLYPPGRQGSYDIPEWVTHIQGNAFQQCTGLTEVIFPSTLTSIGMSAFYQCTGLTEVDFPASITEIGDGAFGENNNLARMRVRSTTPPLIYSGTFGYTFWSDSYVSRDIPVYVPRESIEAYRTAEYWEEFTNFLPIEGESTGIASPTLANAITVHGGEVYIHIIGIGEVQVYDPAGRCVLRTTEQRFTLPQGVYVVQAGGESVRVVVR